MNLQTMEGLLGANANIKIADTPMSVYRQASAEGDEEKAKRALSYTSEHTEKAAQYQEKLEKGIRTEAKAEREKAKLERQASLEQRREERKATENKTNDNTSQKTDTVQLSEAAKAILASQSVKTETPVDGDLVTYTATGEAVAPVESEATVSVSV